MTLAIGTKPLHELARASASQKNIDLAFEYDVSNFEYDVRALNTKITFSGFSVEARLKGLFLAF